MTAVRPVGGLAGVADDIISPVGMERAGPLEGEILVMPAPQAMRRTGALPAGERRGDR